MPGTAHELDVNVNVVLPGIGILLLPNAAVTPLGKPLTESRAVLPLAEQEPGLPIVTLVVAVSVLGATLISFTVPVVGATARL